MRLLLDENLPRKLKWQLKKGEAMTVPERGWSGISNGELLRQAEMEFDVLLTMDRGLEYQQNLAEIEVGIVLLSAPSNDYDDLLPLVPEINRALSQIQAGEVIKVAV